MITTRPNTLDLRSRKLVYTQSGLEVVSSNEELFELVRAFENNPAGFHEELFTDRFKLIGHGNKSDVRFVGGYAVKLSTPTTGGLNRSSSSRDRKMHSPENLIMQMRFMTFLGVELAQNTGGQITAPIQYLAVRPERNHSLSVMQFMEDRVSLQDWVAQKDIEGEQSWQATNIVRDRIETAIGNSALKRGLGDLFRAPHFDDFDQFSGNLHQANILVPASIGSIGDLATANICIIDQPGASTESHFRAWQAMRQISRQPGYIDPFVGL